MMFLPFFDTHRLTFFPCGCTSPVYDRWVSWALVLFISPLKKREVQAVAHPHCEKKLTSYLRRSGCAYQSRIHSLFWFELMPFIVLGCQRKICALSNNLFSDVLVSHVMTYAQALCLGAFSETCSQR